jgi:hypothetical protein
MNLNRTTLIPLAVTALVCLLAGGTLGWLFARGASAPVTAGAAPGERKVLYWTDPMVPGFRSDKPGKSPFMDMELVPVYEDEAAAGGGAPVVSVRPEIANSLGIRTHTVTRGRPARRTTATGYLQRDARGLVLLADIVDRDADWVRAGMAAEVRVAGAGGRAWPARVERVEPDLEIGTRSFRTRVRLLAAVPEPGANTLAEATIQAPAAGGKALIPAEALIRTGSRTVVVLALDAGRFQPVEVVPGAEAGEMIEIRSGLKEGERVVVSGQFLIDSEANVRASFARMQPAEGGAPATPAAPAADPSQHQH